jgi:hypothetical protein
MPSMTAMANTDNDTDVVKTDDVMINGYENGPNDKCDTVLPHHEKCFSH